MKLLSAVCSDRGIKKKINQDSLLVRSAMTKEGEILLAVVCDGMGGLEKGEVASGEVIRALARWFEETLPLLLSGEQEKKGVGERGKRAIAKSLESLIQEENQMISVYGKEKNLLLGTTVSAVLLIAGWYLIVHVGDSRVYGLTEDVQQLTKDQTYVQREIDAGRLTKEQARQHPRRNVLLQCVGVQEKITPEWKSGVYYPGMGFLICSDGFCNQLLHGELEERFCRNYLRAEWEMEENLKEVMEQNKRRMETDNLSAIWISVQ